MMVIKAGTLGRGRVRPPADAPNAALSAGGGRTRVTWSAHCRWGVGVRHQHLGRARAVRWYGPDVRPAGTAGHAVGDGVSVHPGWLVVDAAGFGEGSDPLGRQVQNGQTPAAVHRRLVGDPG